MAIIAARRLTFVEQASRKFKFQGRDLALEISGLSEIESRAANAINHLPALMAIEGIEVRAYTPGGVRLNITSLLGKTAKEIDAMAAEVDEISQAAAARAPQVELPEMIDHPDLPFKVMKKVFSGRSLKDGRELAKQYGGNLRVPTESELILLSTTLGDQLPRNGYGFWTETEDEKCPGKFFVRFVSFNTRDSFHPDNRSNMLHAIRLIQDK